MIFGLKKIRYEREIMKDRYFLDVRVGCAAVRDRQHPDYDESYPGLHNDTLDVVEYRHGTFYPAPALTWLVKKEDIDYLQNLCDKLNVWPERDRKLEKILDGRD
jgi:hypothetical protein